MRRVATKEGAGPGAAVWVVVLSVVRVTCAQGIRWARGWRRHGRETGRRRTEKAGDGDDQTDGDGGVTALACSIYFG